jgi:uncharacterized membrane protein YkgB
MKFNVKRIDVLISRWMKRFGNKYLRLSLAIIFIWFGFLKIINFSPAGQLVAKTVYWVDPSWFVPFLGVWEVLIGLCFLYRPLVRVALLLLFPQMVGTFLPLILLPEVTFQMSNPLLLTMEGQYIIKNLLIITAAIVVGSKVREKETSTEL